ncbi:hemin-degrading factor [Noviherbaspirillum cavernae]|uniref:Hemin-degrading factor n=1 Tax=Noviherbaspirillum cavernae TaxID=2320862 RepID=A0A418WWV2_9BURK|nr:ChuX/HutX family heme-like substrate-binding protein [Noviherbaspirillum cavernae]RJG04714.1 hemin-degrading factor [Noviherbaspirillum cavernae]
MSDNIQSIRASFTQMRKEKARHRDIADKLGISEGELIAAHAGADGSETTLRAARLTSAWSDIIESLEPLGEVMALTRNPSCVHEKTGVYRKASHNGHVGLVLGGEIDLRVFYQQWAHGFAVSETTNDGTQRSLQFFDVAGTAIHKIFLRPQSDLTAYEVLTARFRSDDQQAGITVGTAPAAAAEKPDSEIDVAAFREGWASLRDTHEFFGLLRRFALTRTQALRLAAPEFVQKIDAGSATRLLDAASREGVSIMVFVGNPGMIQIHSGPVKKIATMGPWLNVLDPGFNLHLREDHIAGAWVVKKPTVDGVVTSLELFDAHGETIAMFFGERKPGKPELCEWRALIDRLQEESESCAA